MIIENLIFLKIDRKSLDLEILNHSKTVIFYLILRNTKKNRKNRKFSMQVYIHMKIILNSSDQPFEF